MTCVPHIQEGMIRRPRRRCQDCDDPATYGRTSPERCETHKRPDDLDQVERQCTQCGKVDVLDARGWCINFCVPGGEMDGYKRRQKFKESRMNAVLEEQIDENPELVDTRISAACNGDRSRPDRAYNKGTHWVIVECDEDQHDWYCGLGEYSRMLSIYQALDGPSTVFIRYNPDAFTDHRGIRLQLPQTERELILVQQVRKYLDHSPASPLTVLYLFYDGFDQDNLELIELDPAQEYEDSPVYEILERD